MRRCNNANNITVSTTVNWGTFNYWRAAKVVVMANTKDAFSCNQELRRTD